MGLLNRKPGARQLPAATVDKRPPVTGPGSNLKPGTLPRGPGEPDPPAPLGSLVAAAKRLGTHKVVRTSKQGWQDEAWDLYDEVGELRYTANALASALSRTRLFAARLPMGDENPTPIEPDDDGKDPKGNPLPSEAVTAAEMVQTLGGGSLGRSEILRRLAVHLFVPGDGYIVGLPPGALDEDPDEEEAPDPAVAITPAREELTLDQLAWHAFNVNEIAVAAGKVTLSLGDGERREFAGDDAVLIRVWRPHPNRWWQADSPVKANLPVLRELVGLTKHVAATIDSRLAGAGLLVLPQSVELVQPPGEDGQPNPDADPDFVEALIDTMVAPIANRDIAAAVVPMVIKVPDEVAAQISQNNLIRFSTPFDERTKELRDEAIRRLALGLDAPPEVLLGLGSTNHWSAWQIEESTVKVHIEPVIALICDALTTDYLWPAMRAAGVTNYRDYVVWFDTTDLTMRPNRVKEAEGLYDRDELSGRALRRESGFEDSDAPEPMEPATAMALRLVEANPALIVDPGLDRVVEAIRQVMETGLAVGAGQTPPSPAPEPADSGMGLPERNGQPPASAPMAASARRG